MMQGHAKYGGTESLSPDLGRQLGVLTPLAERLVVLAQVAVFLK